MSRCQQILSQLAVHKQSASYIGTIAILVGILYLGHLTHWKFSPHGTHAGANHADSNSEHKHGVAKKEAAESSDQSVDLAETNFQLGAKVLAKAGIELGHVERRSLTTSITASGVVAYNHNLRAELSTRAPGNVWRIEKRAGETIRKGDVLAIIEASEVGRAKGELLRAIVECELKNTNYERVKPLDKSVAERLVREAQAAARQAEIQAQVCAQALVNLGLPVKIEELKKLGSEERARQVQFLGLPESIVGSLDPATTTANLIPLVAPFDGVVIGRDISIGEVVSPADPHFVIADIRKVWVLLEIPKEHVKQVRLGQQITFSPDGFDGEVKGTVDWMSTQMDEKTRTLQVRAEVENPLSGDSIDSRPTYLLRANTYGSGAISIRHTDDALVVPTEAVQFDRGTNYVFVREGERFRSAVVKVGTREGRVTEIVSGLAEGMEIATSGSHVLKAQMQLLAAAR